VRSAFPFTRAIKHEDAPARVGPATAGTRRLGINNESGGLPPDSYQQRTCRSGRLFVLLAPEHDVRCEVCGNGFHHPVAEGREIQALEHRLAPSERDRRKRSRASARSSRACNGVILWRLMRFAVRARKPRILLFIKIR
jgi:hypothetical protein